MVVPTLAADDALAECIESLGNQSFRDFELIVVDNSGQQRVRCDAARPWMRVISNTANAGFGAAINQAFRVSDATFLATLNDDAVAQPGWLEALLRAASANGRVGMCASRVVLTGERALDSAGMLVCRDGSSKQRGHLEDPESYSGSGPALLPSGSAALYRREMLDEIGLFDESFFLYCEDTDLGLRARWAGWECVYVADAAVEHRYSHSAGRASPLKAFYVERNRLFLIAKLFPVSMLLLVPFYTLVRYSWHAIYALQGRGMAAHYRAGNPALSLLTHVLRAHAAAIAHVGTLLRERRRVTRRISPREFAALIAANEISPRQVAVL